MARKGKPKRPAPPPAQRRPSGLVVVVAFAIAIGAAVSLIALAVALRTTEDEGADPTPTPVVDLDGIPQEGRALGSPEADVTLVEYADLQCPACRAYTESYFPEIVDRYVRPGRVRTEFRGLAFIGPDSETALRWVLAAGLQNRLWHLQEALYRNQGGENSGWVTEELLRRLAGEIPGLDADRVLADAQGDEVSAQVAEAAAQAEAAEIRGTPGLAIQVGEGEPTTLEPGVGLSELTAALDDALGS
jgi:protein-disulfide isomerase